MDVFDGRATARRLAGTSDRFATSIMQRRARPCSVSLRVTATQLMLAPRLASAWAIFDITVSEPAELAETCLQCFFRDPTGNLIELNQPI